MTLIDRYVMSTFLRVLGWAVLAFISLFLIVDLFDHLDNFLDDNASIFSVAKYYMYHLPSIIDLCLPVGMLLASLFTIGVLSKNNEYSAILSAGVSLARMTRTVLLLGLLVSVAAWGFREYIVSEANHRKTDVRRHEIAGKVKQDLKSKRNFTYVGQRGEVYIVNSFRPNPPSLHGLSVQIFGDSTMIRRIDAEKAVWDGESWELERGAVREFENGVETVTGFSTRVLDESAETPKDFSRREVNAEDMNYRELVRFAEWVGRTGGNPTPYLASMAHQMSFPLVNFLLVVLGLALGAGRKKTTLWAGFGLTVGLAFFYYLLMDFGLSLGKNGSIPVWASAWTGNILYGTLGLVLFSRANR